MDKELLLALTFVTVAALALASAKPYKEALNLYIADPSQAVPMPVSPGGVFNITLYSASKIAGILGVWAEAPGYVVNLSLTLPPVQVGHSYVITVGVPSSTRPELYDLYVKVSFGSSSQAVSAYRSLWVLSKWPRTLRIMHLTDVHIGAAAFGAPAADCFKKAIVLANALPVDVVVITGDDVEYGDDTRSLETLSSLLDYLRKPTFIIPGNHDYFGAAEESFEKYFYGRYIGPAYWYRAFGDYLIIGLDSGLEGFLDSQQLDWLESVLSRYAGKTTVVFIHHPLFSSSGVISSTSYDVASDPSSRLLYLLDKYNACLVLAGHIHRDTVAIYKNKIYFVTTTAACAWTQLYPGFRLVTISSKGEVLELTAPGKRPFDRGSSYNLMQASVSWVSDGRGTASSYLVYTTGRFEVNLATASFYFWLAPGPGYSLYASGIDASLARIAPFRGGLLAEVRAPLRPNLNATMTVASYVDNDNPTIEIVGWTPETPVSGRQPLTIFVRAVDRGWGMARVVVYYSTGTSSDYVTATPVQGNIYKADIPPLFTKELYVRAVAVDVAGHTSQVEAKITYAVPQPPQPPPQQPPPQQSQTQQPPYQAPQQTQQQNQTPLTTAPAPPATTARLDYTPLVAALVAGAVGVAVALALVEAARRRR
ncbi:metallophosphoesterase [Infirmifilum lucidum]|uniref:Metallophosphoesterase n=1 Tax=Infirmifilum lucidum TaxID=2776706 RepID=A0A7L9FII9_9CREN|nr:metallophosphoesterase [Infirmifilum lucidum]QOJ78736.1 metallophosphoesterase [Infirmifilum lucidum]